MSAVNKFYSLQSDNSSLIIDCQAKAPAILYWGARFSDATSPEMLALLATRQGAQACVDTDPPLTLSPEPSTGFQGTPGIQVHRDGKQWAVYATLLEVIEHNSQDLELVSICDATEIEIRHRLTLDATTDVLKATTTIKNQSTHILSVDRCDAPCIPLPMAMDSILSFEGRWANEFQRRTVKRHSGSFLRENRAGRTSHDTFPGFVVHGDGTNENAGEAYGLHLGWSGNHRMQMETLSADRGFAMLGELFLPGELRLDANATYASPPLYGVHTSNGFSAMSQQFHRYVRNHLTDDRVNGKTRPVHFNTWEAMYFTMTPDSVVALANRAAAVGAERFVLDDGWFRGRNADNAGLGDWFVDEEVFPDGLTPVIDHVQSLGMEFGLWVEPEMVNPDSDLYREHPDWVLNTASAPLLLSRNQLVLDLTRSEVAEYLFARMDALLSENQIAYLKWDMNRNLDQPGDANGRAAVHRQTLAFYDLLDRVREAHKHVVIESCASGGARADYGVLRHTDRIWTSDSNDALDRLRIQAGFSYFFPPEVMGSHVGPDECHITGRRLSMSLRAGVALMGSMGIEANLNEISEAEESELRAAVALHKKHRELIMTGNHVRLDLQPYENGFGVVSEAADEGIFSYALVDTLPGNHPAVLRLSGLMPRAVYTLTIIWPQQPVSYSRSILDVIDGASISGEALMNAGMQLPILKPESLLLIHLKRRPN